MSHKRLIKLFCSVIASIASHTACAQAQTQTQTPSAEAVLLNQAASSITSSSAQSILRTDASSSALSGLFQKQSAPTAGEPLPVERAFALSATRQANKLNIRWDIASGYYVYKDKIEINAVAPLKLSGVKLPQGIVQYDETFGKNVATYRTQLSVDTVQVSAADDTPVTLHVYSQGCSDLGICYPPQRQEVSFLRSDSKAIIRTLDYIPSEQQALAANKTSDLAVPQTQANTAMLTPQSTTTINTNTALNPSSDAPSLPLKATDNLLAQLSQSHPLWLALTFIGFGLLLSFTPCVLPMMPIVSAIVLGQAVNRTEPPASPSTRGAIKGLKLSAAYVLGMCLCYTAIGLLAGLLGASLNGYLQHPVLLSVFALIMFVLAGAQFGWYELSMPQQWHTHLETQTSDTGDTRVKHYLLIAIIGALSALMVGPCVTAPLAGTLTYIAQTGNVWIGGLALFSLALGMGIPLLIIGAGGARYLPKSGPWMNQVSYGFGILLLMVALWMVQSLLPAWILTAAWLIIILLVAQWLGAFKPLTSGQTRGAGIARALAWMCLVWAAAIVWGMASGRFDALQPLAGSQAGNRLTTAAVQTHPFQIVNAQDLDKALQTAQGKPVLLDLYADWCVSCHEFERFTFRDAQVASALNQFHLIKVDLTRNTAADQKLLKTLGLFGPPGILFFTAQGKEIKASRVIGFQAAPAFLQHLKLVLDSNR